MGASTRHNTQLEAATYLLKLYRWSSSVKVCLLESAGMSRSESEECGGCLKREEVVEAKRVT